MASSNGSTPAARPSGYLTAVEDASFTLSPDPPQVVSLVGQSGSGKSTIARNVLGLQKPTSGTIKYGGKDIFKLDRAEYDDYRRNVQPVFQDPYAIFNPFYRVDRVLWKAVKKFNLAKSQAEGLAMIERSLEAVKLEPDARPRPVPAPAVRWPAATGDAGQDPHAPAGLRDRRRTGLDARRPGPQGCSSTSCWTSSASTA